MRSNPLSDNEIAALVAEGRCELFGELVERYQRPVYRLACGILGNKGDAEDAAQDVFVRAYKNLSSYRGSGSFWAWLRKITLNLCIRRIRPARDLSLDEIGDDDSRLRDTPGHEADTVLESVIGSMESAELRAAVVALPPIYRTVIVLRYLEEMSYTEIADAIGVSLANVRARLHRAKQMLRERMKVSAT